MAAWFSKAFKSKPGAAAPASRPAPAPVAIDDDDFDGGPRPRRVVQAPVLVDESEQSGWSAEVRIKARFDAAADSAVFLIDRPVLEGYSFHCGGRDAANAQCPLAAAIFDLGGIAAVTVHGFTVTVKRDGTGRDAWEEKARAIAGQIRAHLKSGMPVLHPEVLEAMPSEDEIRTALQRAIDLEINPGIAGHSGYLTLNRVQGNTVYIAMGGGCQGCAASSITLRQGVEQTFRAAVPLMGALLDETDHAAGENPYFSSLPAGMGA